ncbi:hypothetical protein BOW39_13110 [Solemya velum gill symbiont]|uniref:DUF3427 domain-containing protein n=1 Tax=Solemya velum gill symbiont TaxID=2340 RepID=UPI0009987CC8|nr:DUF3427 domain-containing protein [Solemya velum gill symbiont]OOZ47033.1 hypothetical protein BOW39_13110 [Solemya velum gill symbiont]
MFKRGSKYTRKDIGWIYLPETGRPKGGSWDTGYVRVENDLIIFMNIGVPGKTEHDFDNRYDEETETIVWYGKPNAHSQQPTFQDLLSGKLTLHFFARWDNKDPQFTYIGVGKVIEYKDGAVTKSGIKTIELKLHVDDVDLIIPEVKKDTGIERSSFMFEKHLEDFLITNWDHTPLSKKYKIFEENGEQVGKQFKTDTGPLDILAISKDGNEFLVVELKRDRASDVVVGQVLRYMGWIKKNLCTEDQVVKGCIIAQDADQRIEHALYAVSDVFFMKYEVDFRLISSSEVLE